MSAGEGEKGGRLILAGGFSDREGLCFPSHGVCVPYSSFSTRRRALYIVTYLLFPINVLVGVLAGVWRMVISGLYNAIHFCQLDISLLNRGVETFDPGRNLGGVCLQHLCEHGGRPPAIKVLGDMASGSCITWSCWGQGWLQVRGQQEQVALPDACFSITHPQGQAMPCWGPLGFTSGQTLFPRAVDPHVSCAKGSREGTSTLPLLFLLGFWERSSALKAEQLWQGRDRAWQTTLLFAPGQEGRGEP